MSNSSQFKIFKGYWWLPSNPDDKVAGVMTYTPGENIKLELIGEFSYGGGHRLSRMFDDKEEELIYGIESGAKEITLLNCRKRTSYNFSCPFPLTYYYAGLAVYDKHISGLDEVCDYTANIRYPELSHWCFPGLIQTELSFENDELTDTHIHIKRLSEEDEVIAQSVLKDGTELKLKRGGEYNMGEHRLEPHIRQYTTLSLHNPSGLSIRQILNLSYRFEQFLSFATLRNVRRESICLKDPDISQTFEDGSKYLFPIYLYQPRLIVDNPKEIDSGNFLFDYEDIKEDFPRFVSSWLAGDEDTNPIINHLVDSLTYKKTFGSVDFLVVIQAIEGFWWRFRDQAYRKRISTSDKKSTHLKTIINELLSEFSDVQVVGKLKNTLDVNAVVDSRHYYSHFMQRSSKPHTKEGKELYDLTKGLKKILICCVMSLLGVERRALNGILAKAQI